MIHFNRLRLSGFKSFVDTTDVPVEPGVTGIVGPNGCGKSNLVEALIWVMGEISARHLRGSEMDDVIFSGSATRPSRNLAEVSLQLDNRTRQAGAQFNNDDELEVTRRIERGRFSSYRVNGREVRARDVQTLFADASSGARSAAFISQGKIGSLISAKPNDRRGLLEDAAGIGGLHVRRHEAELRLKAAETNLNRLQDVMTELDQQLVALKKQARQAARYRGIAEQIRKAESRLLAARWILVQQALEAAQAATTEAEAEVNRLTEIAAVAAGHQAEAAAALPPLRQAEAEAASALQKLQMAREQLLAEEARLVAAQREVEQRLNQINGDEDREASRIADAERALEQLAGERETLHAADGQEDSLRAAAETEAQAAGQAASAAEAELGRALQSLAAADAALAAAQQARRDAVNRGQRLTARRSELTAKLEETKQGVLALGDTDQAAAAVEAAQSRLETLRSLIEETEHRLEAARAERERRREALQAAKASRHQLTAEAAALRNLLTRPAASPHPPALDSVTVVPGYETALGAALGDDLSAPVEAEAAIAWRGLPPLDNPPFLPAGVEPLVNFVTAPPALARRLSQIGIVADAAAGDSLRSSLLPGQRLVSRDGGLWRWDGFVLRPGAPTAAATRLHQRNRLQQLEQQIEAANITVASAETEAAEATSIAERDATAEREAREAARAAEGEAARLRNAHTRLMDSAAAARSRLAGLTEQEAAVAAEIAEAVTAEQTAATAEAEAMPQGAEWSGRVAMLRGDLAEKHARLVTSRGIFEQMRRDAQTRKERLAAIGNEENSWRDRAAAAERHRGDLAERRASALEERERLASLPADIATQREALRDDISIAEETRLQATAALTDAEQRQTATDRALREAEHNLSGAREERIRREAAVSGATQSSRELSDRINERLELTPEALMEEQDEINSEDTAGYERRLERLVRERDEVGPVNLRAEAELETLEARITEITTERDDLVAAIGKLRHAIAELNREGRERLLASFTEVDRHFQELFTRLFGGGRAHLSLTDAEDPLESGLEIMASPPGKRLQVLSLLSGGEQALTALSLLFAVFLTNPAPICVLDEVDAPLDDANVDRFCTLVGEIAAHSQTRFLVVTHHRMTMARMDRLFGVTMTERGVSKLVSVDLEAAERLREPA